jgi:hypothetical protein
VLPQVSFVKTQTTASKSTKSAFMKKLLFLCVLLISFQGFAQKLPSIFEKTANLKKYDGFMPFYWDEDSGKIWLEILSLGW